MVNIQCWYCHKQLNNTAADNYFCNKNCQLAFYQSQYKPLG